MEGTLTFAPWETSKTVDVATFGDDEAGPDETVFLILSNPSGGAGLEDGKGVGRIVNDDASRPPIARDDSLFVPRCGIEGVDLAANDTLQSSQFSAEIVNLQRTSDVSLGFITTTPQSTSIGYWAGEQGGTEVLTYTIRDASGLTSTATLRVTVSYEGSC